MKFRFVIIGLSMLALLGCDETVDPPDDAAMDASTDGPPSDVSPDVVTGVTCDDLEAGSFDPTFGGGDGYVAVSLGDGSTELGKELSILPDGSIYVSAELRPPGGSARFALVRFAADGTLDTGFGGDGWSELDLGVNADVPVALTVRNGRGTLAGYATVDGELRGALVRFDDLGLPDTRLGGTGSVTYDLAPGQGERLAGVVFDRTDRMLVAGTVGDREGLLVARFDDQGVLDPTFATNGVALITGAGSMSGDSAAIDGNLLVAGGTLDGLFGITRFDEDGLLDVGFSGDGRVDTGQPGTVHGVLRDILGYYVIVGSHDDPVPTLTIARFIQNGGTDPMFAGGLYASHGIGADESIAYSVAQDQRGKMVIVGEAVTGGVVEMVVVRTLSDGTLDLGFAEDGVRRMVFDGVDASLRGVQIDEEGRIVTSGWATVDGEIELVVARICS